MTRVLILITDDGKTITVDLDYSPPPGEDPTPAQRLADKIAEFLRNEFGARTE